MRVYYSVLVLLFSSIITCNNLLAKIFDNNLNSRTSTYWFVTILRFTRCKPHTTAKPQIHIAFAKQNNNQTTLAVNIVRHNTTVCLPHDNRDDNYCRWKTNIDFLHSSFLCWPYFFYNCYQSATNRKYKWILGHLLHFLNLCILFSHQSEW